MQYAIITYETPAAVAARTDPAKAPAYWAAWNAYAGAIAAAGVMRGGAGLEPTSTATTVRVRGDRRTVHDGPFAETKELLGGFFIIEVDNLDEALAWAARCPSSADGSTEVRPVLRM